MHDCVNDNFFVTFEAIPRGFSLVTESFVKIVGKSHTCDPPQKIELCLSLYLFTDYLLYLFVVLKTWHLGIVLIENK